MYRGKYILPAALLLSACSANGQTPVVTELTSEAVETVGSADTARTTTSQTASETAASETEYVPPVFVSGAARVTVEGTKFMANGRELWINGVNTPWDKWNDFGNGSFDPDFWEEHFAELEAAGINASRVWINCSGFVGVRLNGKGEVTNVSEKHWRDLDCLFESAERHHIYIMATLISFDHFKDSNLGHKNWRNMLTTPESIKSFNDDYVIPFVKRYDSCDYLWSIDLCNEPDWIRENEECGKIDWEYISDYFAETAAAIHENSDILVTVGMGMVKYNSDDYSGNYVSDKLLKTLGNEDSYLDFYSPHYYFWMTQNWGDPFAGSPEDYKLDGTKPVVIGETPADTSEGGVTLKDEYSAAYDNGWNGVMAWTSNGVDGCGGLDDIRPAAEYIAEEKLAAG